MRNILFICFFLFSTGVIAQGYFWESAGKPNRLKYLTVEAGLGLRMFSGDVQQRGSLFNPVKFAYGLGARYQPRPHIGFSLQLGGRGYKGKAEHGGYPDAIDELNGKLWEGNLTLQYSILQWADFTKRTFTDRDPVTKGNVFIGVGGGAAMFNGSYTSRTYDVRTIKDSLGQDTTIATPIDRSGSGAGIGFYVPIEFGLRYRFSPVWSMSFTTQYHLYFSDNLDGIVRGQNDGMTLFMLKVAYSFGQTKTAAQMGKTPRQLRKGR